MPDIIEPPAAPTGAPTTPAATGLAAAIADLDSAPQGSGLNPGDDFMALFNKDVPEVGVEKPAEVQKPEGEPEPKAEDKPEGAGEGEEDDPHGEAPDPKDAKANEKWVGLKSELKKTRADLRAERDKVATELQTRDAKIAEKEGRVAQLEKEIATLAEIKEKAARAEELEKELSIHRVESSDHYKRSVTEPLNAISDRLEEIAKDSGVDVNALFDAVSEPDPAKQRAALKEIAENLNNPIDAAFIARAAEDTRAILTKRDQIRADASNARKELEEKQTAEAARAKEAAQKEIMASFDTVAESLKKRLPFVELAKGETADGVFAAMVEQAKATDFENMTPHTKAFMAFAGIAIARAAKQAQAQDAYIKKLEGRVKEDTDTSPKVEGKEPLAPKGESKDFLSDMAGFLGQSTGHSGFVPGG